MKIAKKGLFGDVNKSVSSIYKLRKINQNSYSAIINSFTDNSTVKNLIFQYIESISYNISSRVLRNQLSLLSNLTLDDQIKVVNRTLEKGWQTLIPAYKDISENKRVRFDNVKSDFISKTDLSKNTDIVEEKF